ncbi:MAG: molybdopterin-dependent oxidoreductase [Chloroflexota bacterium]
MSHTNHTHDALQPHAHDPNPAPPSADPDFMLSLPDGTDISITVSDLQQLPKITLTNCYIVSTGHGTSGPFTFTGVTLLTFIEHYLPPNTAWSQAEVISADGFGNRVFAEELFTPDPAGPMLLSYQLDGMMMTREQGLVRLIVRSEKDDALRQVKWVGRISIKP